MLGSAGRDLPLDSACATDAAWGLVTADAGINWPHSAFVITHDKICCTMSVEPSALLVCLKHNRNSVSGTHTSDTCCQAGEGPTDTAEDDIVPQGSYIYERRPGMPQAFMTKQDVKRASKKEQKLARRAQRNSAQQSGKKPTYEPTAVATNLHFGKFEQHTTGYGSRMLARWGFAGQGAGLGRAQQGIAEPVAAFVRPKKLGLGHN